MKALSCVSASRIGKETEHANETQNGKGPTLMKNCQGWWFET